MKHTCYFIGKIAKENNDRGIRTYRKKREMDKPKLKDTFTLKTNEPYNFSETREEVLSSFSDLRSIKTDPFTTRILTDPNP